MILQGKRRAWLWLVALVGVWVLVLGALRAWGDPATHSLPDQGRQRGVWHGDLHGGYAQSGCLPSVPGSGLSLGSFACEGYVQDTTTGELLYTRDPGSTLGPVSGTSPSWVLVRADTSTIPTSWTCKTGSRYCHRQSASQPTQPTRTLLLAKLTVSGGNITAVTDYRVSSALLRHGYCSVRDALFNVPNDGTSTATALAQVVLSNAICRRVYFPAGTYLITGGNSQQTDGLSLQDAQEIFGDGPATILKQNANSYYIASVNQYEGGTSSASGNKTHIYLHDLKLLSTVDTDGFAQHYHQLNVNAVSDLVVERVWFYGMRGDGMYIGSGNSGAVERHNERIVVRNSIFDGINKLNRQGISIIDCNNCVIEGNYFTRLSRADMPGPIDVEPNAGDVFPVLQNIVVRNNRFYNNGGNVATFSVVLQDLTYTTAPFGFFFENNYVDTGFQGFSFGYPLTGGITTATANFHIRIANNFMKTLTNRPFTLAGAKDAVVSGNTFDAFAYSALVGYTATANKVLEIVVDNNLFYQGGTSDGVCLAVFSIDRLLVQGNTFIDCGTGGTGKGIDFNTGTSTFVQLVHNRFLAPGGGMSAAIGKEAGHTYTAVGNVLRDNDLGGLTHSFYAYRSDAVNHVQDFDTTTLPDTFPPGKSIGVINGDASAPDASKQGYLITEKHMAADSTYRKFITQVFKSANNDATSRADIWHRQGTSGANTWQAWYRLSGTTVAVQTYTPTNVSTDRSYDANATSLDELADVLGTLILDLQNARIIQ